MGKWYCPECENGELIHYVDREDAGFIYSLKMAWKTLQGDLEVECDKCGYETTGLFNYD